MYTTKKTMIALALGALVLPMSAYAANPGFYVGGKIGAASTSQTFIDDDDTSFGIYGGYRFSPNFALEAEYTDFGNLEVDLSDLAINNARAEPRTWGVKAVGFVPIGTNFELLGSVGYHSFDLDPSDNQGFRDIVGSSSSTDLFYGIGGQFNFDGGLSLRAQYQRYEFKSAGRSDEISLGLHYRF
jgi:OmpA-OmpF porin, OOP family